MSVALPIAGTERLRASIRAARATGRPLLLRLSPLSFALGGSAISIHLGDNVTLYSEGRGATLDAEWASSAVTVSSGGRLVLKNVHITQGKRCIVVGSGGELVLERVMIQGCMREPNANGYAMGAGAYVAAAGQLVLRNVLIENATAWAHDTGYPFGGHAFGGGIAVHGGSLTMSNTTILKATAVVEGSGDALGGALFMTEGSSTLHNVTIMSAVTSSGTGACRA